MPENVRHAQTANVDTMVFKSSPSIRTEENCLDTRWVQVSSYRGQPARKLIGLNRATNKLFVRLGSYNVDSIRWRILVAKSSEVLFKVISVGRRSRAEYDQRMFLGSRWEFARE